MPSGTLTGVGGTEAIDVQSRNLETDFQDALSQVLTRNKAAAPEAFEGNGDTRRAAPEETPTQVAFQARRATIYNRKALLRSHQSIALGEPRPLHAQQSITASDTADVPDIDDDLQRELAFYKQCLKAARVARHILLKEGILVARPHDFFAEMVKSDEQMDRVKDLLAKKALNRKAAAESRKQRALKEFGKSVQVAKRQEREKARRDTLDMLKMAKSRQSGRREDDAQGMNLPCSSTNASDRGKRSWQSSQRASIEGRRQRKDTKYGFGGKKRHSKSGDSMSSGDLRGSGTSSKKRRDRIAPLRKRRKLST